MVGHGPAAAAHRSRACRGPSRTCASAPGATSSRSAISTTARTAGGAWRRSRPRSPLPSLHMRTYVVVLSRTSPCLGLGACGSDSATMTSSRRRCPTSPPRRAPMRSPQTLVGHVEHGPTDTTSTGQTDTTSTGQTQTQSPSSPSATTTQAQPQAPAPSGTGGDVDRHRRGGTRVRRHPLRRHQQRHAAAAGPAASPRRVQPVLPGQPGRLSRASGHPVSLGLDHEGYGPPARSPTSSRTRSRSSASGSPPRATPGSTSPRR